MRPRRTPSSGQQNNSFLWSNSHLNVTLPAPCGNVDYQPPILRDRSATIAVYMQPYSHPLSLPTDNYFLDFILIFSSLAVLDTASQRRSLGKSRYWCHEGGGRERLYFWLLLLPCSAPVHGIGGGCCELLVLLLLVQLGSSAARATMRHQAIAARATC